ncbi:hypothetical protein PBY51_020452 [Eleginops maclovinus]|uniref:Uncharacterized protein n=1 Tax=Eleginops maclovinus TaxID=56733 RepID=A0AAN8AKP9_ELEMC|nr:hypothetical protein PBY51_020452 [Eleginops maclovinus]
MLLSGCHICTSIKGHCELVDDMCRHVKDLYRSPECLATGSHQEQTNMLRSAAQHQSPVWCEVSPDTRAFLDAVSSVKRLRGNCQTELLPVVCRRTKQQVKSAMAALKEELSPFRCDVASLLQDNIVHMITAPGNRTVDSLISIDVEVILPLFTCDVDHAFYIHPDTIFHSILRENLTDYI